MSMSQEDLIRKAVTCIFADWIELEEAVYKDEDSIEENKAKASILIGDVINLLKENEKSNEWGIAILLTDQMKKHFEFQVDENIFFLAEYIYNTYKNCLSGAIDDQKLERKKDLILSGDHGFRSFLFSACHQ